MNRLYFAFIILLSFVYVSSDTTNLVEDCYNGLRGSPAPRSKSDITHWEYCVMQKLQVSDSCFKWTKNNYIYRPQPTQSSPIGNKPNMIKMRRIRKEYRMLSDEERFDFHRSIYLLKQDTTISPNIYDSIAFLHTGETARNAHAGPPFLLWHRIYLKMMEDALREKVPGVTIPFWDPTLDSHLPNSRDSIIWSDKLMGNVNGFVNTGPFANWTTPAGPLVRNGGFNGDLPTYRNIEDVLSRTRLEEISEPNALERYNFEFMHNLMHVSIGGQMSMVPSSPMDPFFWLLHSYIELVHTRFNENQRKNNIDPATDYPSDYGLDVYAPNQSIGLMNLTIAEALKETQKYISIYRYDYNYLLGNCTLNPNQCNSPYLTCNNGRCVSKSKKSTGCGSLIPYQNLFCINRRCDLEEWVFMPIEIIYERPFETMKFGNFPVINGLPNLLNDLYDDNLPLNSSSGNSNETCRISKCCGPAGRLNVRAFGLNYFGSYEEMVVVDRRLAVSSNIAYMGIRNPARNYSMVFFTASEQCGRICRPSCLVPGSNPPRYTECIGFLNITTNNATFYGKTLADAFMKVWDYKNQIRPKLRHENIPIVFHCDDSRWPYTNDSIINTTTTSSAPTTTTPPPTTTTTPPPTTTTTPPPTTTTTPPPTTTTTTTTPSPKSCYLNEMCTVAKGCDCITMQKESCINTCSHYAICVYGKYMTVSCGFGRRFHPRAKRCVRGYCHR